VDGEEAGVDRLQAGQNVVALFVYRNDVNQALAVMALTPKARQKGGRKVGEVVGRR
jgi:hypothetical protein